MGEEDLQGERNHSSASRGSFVYPFAGGWLLYYPLSDRLLALNQTGKTVWELWSGGWGVEEITAAFAQQFQLRHEEVAGEVGLLLADLTDASLPSVAMAPELAAMACARDTIAGRAADPIKSEDCGIFRFGANHIRVISAVEGLDGAFFARFGHRAVADASGADVLEVAEGDDGFRMVFQGSLLEQKRTVSNMMSSVVRLLLTLEHPGKALLAYCHAAAVSRSGRSVLMPGSSGVGKSTLTAFLVANGFSYLCDDTCAIAVGDAELLPLPTCLSIKSGSWSTLEPLYPVLARTPTLNRYGRSARYVEPQENYETMAAGPAPSAMVFPAYQAGAPTRLVALPLLQTMERLVGAHARLTIPASEEKLASLIRFVEQTPAYELTYSDLPGAMQAIEGLLASRPE